MYKCLLISEYSDQRNSFFTQNSIESKTKSAKFYGFKKFIWNFKILESQLSSPSTLMSFSFSVLKKRDHYLHWFVFKHSTSRREKVLCGESFIYMGNTFSWQPWFNDWQKALLRLVSYNAKLHSFPEKNVFLLVRPAICTSQCQGWISVLRWQIWNP